VLEEGCESALRTKFMGMRMKMETSSLNFRMDLSKCIFYAYSSRYANITELVQAITAIAKHIPDIQYTLQSLAFPWFLHHLGYFTLPNYLLFLLFRLLLLIPHSLPPHKITAKREQHCIDRRPRKQNPEIESDPRMNIEDNCSACIDNVMQRPSVSPKVKPWRKRNGVKACRHIRNNPKNEPESRPRLSYHHRDILTRQT